MTADKAENERELEEARARERLRSHEDSVIQEGMRSRAPKTDHRAEVDQFPKEAAVELWRKAQVRHDAEIAVGRFFAQVKSEFGLDEARRLFAPFAPLPQTGVPRKPRKRPPKEARRLYARSAPPQRRDVPRKRRPEEDRLLISHYNWVVANGEDKAAAPRRIAELVHTKSHRQFGEGPEAIEKRLRRLLKKRASAAVRLNDREDN